jgi:hypothetical protein
LACDSWGLVRLLLVKKFGNDLKSVTAKKDAIAMKMKNNETIAEFIIRFIRAMDAAIMIGLTLAPLTSFCISP